MSEFRMPSLGADMEAGTLVEWHVKPGDHVKRGDIVAVVDTDKAAIEIEVFEGGVVDQILVVEGTRVPVGTPLALIRGDGEEAAPVPQQIAESKVAPPTIEEPERHLASPLARRLAKDLGLDLSRVQGSGPGGVITREDIEHAAGLTPAAQAVEAVPQPVAGKEGKRLAMRNAIAALMARSKREIPHYYLATTIDMSRASAFLDEWNASHGVADRILPAVLQLKAIALALREIPEMNGFFSDGAFHPSEAIHPGVAISLRDEGLIAPAIHDADTKSLLELMHDLRELVKRARAGVLRASEMSDPTITITNLGDQGVEEVFGVIYPPQVALVGFGRIVERPWAAGGMVGSHPVVRATLSADHRVSDGHRGALFLSAIDRLLQKPEEL